MKKTTVIKTRMFHMEAWSGLKAADGTVILPATKAIHRQETKTVTVQKAKASRRGTSSLGTRYVKGDPILRFSSNRATGEIFTLTMADLERVSKWGVSRVMVTK